MKRLLLIGLLCCYGTGNLAFAQEVKPSPTVFAAKPAQDSEDSLEITITDNKIKVANAKIGSKIEVFSIVGVKVKEIEIKDPNGEYVLNIAKGYYIFRIGDTTRKIVIR